MLLKTKSTNAKSWYVFIKENSTTMISTESKLDPIEWPLVWSMLKPQWQIGMSTGLMNPDCWRLPPTDCDKMWWITQLGTSINKPRGLWILDVIDNQRKQLLIPWPILAEQRSTWHSSCHWFFHGHVPVKMLHLAPQILANVSLPDLKSCYTTRYYDNIRPWKSWDEDIIWYHRICMDMYPSKRQPLAMFQAYSNSGAVAVPKCTKLCTTRMMPGCMIS